MNNDKSVYDHLKQWQELINKQQRHEDVYTTLDILPNIVFKNLSVTNDSSVGDTTSLEITFKYDDFREL